MPGGRCSPSFSATRSIALALLLSAVMALGRAAGQPLLEEDFRQIGAAGLGDRANSYAWGMAYFQNKIYIGTNRNFLCAAPLQGSFASGDKPQIPVDCEPDLLDMDMRARIYTYDPRTHQIELVHVAPTVDVLLSSGQRVQVARDHGYRTMEVFQESDGTPALYVGSMISPKLPGALHARLIRSMDGATFEEVPLTVSRPAYTSFRALTSYNGRLFVLGRSPKSADPALLELVDAQRGFVGVSDGSFGDPTNTGGFEMEVFKGYLYIGTFNDERGFQLLKTQATGVPPYIFQKVLADGAYRGSANQSVVSLKEFQDRLYVGTGVFFGSAALNPEFKPTTAELLRVAPDDSWELVVGEERSTPDGYRTPLSGYQPGFGNAFTGYMWRMIVHDGVLYLGTLDNSIFAQYAEDIDLAEFTEDTVLETYPELAEWVEEFGPEEIADVITALEGGFDLWSTEDGRDWTMVTRKGLNDEFNYGIRNFISLPQGLYVGSANPFLGLRFYVGQQPGTDSDGDSHDDASDNCPKDWNLSQADLDGDGIGDECDLDRDGDCIVNSLDALPEVKASGSADLDGDGLPDDCDADVDNDVILNLADNCPRLSNANQRDDDRDGIGNVCEPVEPDDPDPIDDGDTARPTPGTALCGAAGWALPVTFLMMGLMRLMQHGRPKATAVRPAAHCTSREHQIAPQRHSGANFKKR